MAKIVNDVVTWLKQWFYTEDEIDTKVQGLQGQINNKASQSDLNTLSSAVENKVDKITGKGLSEADFTNAEKTKLAGIADGANKTVVDSSLSSTSTNPVQNKAINTALGGKADTNHTHSISNVTNLQTELNGLDTRLDNLESIKAIQVVTTLPTASASTIGKLYIVSEHSEVNVYYTEQNGTNYAWHKMDTDILDELTFEWSDINNNPFSNSTPSTFATANHVHGNINNDGTFNSVLAGYTSSSNIQEILAINSQNSKIISCSLGTLISTMNLPPKSHSSSATTYGVGTTANYGHNKVINDLTHNSFTNGESLSAYQGYVLNQAIQTKQDKGDCITSIELVPKSDDSTGAIRLYYGDEPTNNS